jgi:hypothetical protein
MEKSFTRVSFSMVFEVAGPLSIVVVSLGKELGRVPS